MPKQINIDVCDEIKKACLAIIPNCTVLLFGSQARNEATNNSDYDILVISENVINDELKREYKRNIRKILASHHIPIDIILQNKEEVNDKKEITGHIVRTAMREAISL